MLRSDPAMARVVPLEFQEMLRELMRWLIPHSYIVEESTLSKDAVMVGYCGVKLGIVSLWIVLLVWFTVGGSRMFSSF